MIIKNKENEKSHPPKFMLPSISSLPNPSPLNAFQQQMNNHESADAILRGSSTFPTKATLSARNPQLFDTKNFGCPIKQESKITNPNFYLPNPSMTYDSMNPSYPSTYWPAYYSEYPYQFNKDINVSPYNVPTWSTNDTMSMYNNNNKQEYLRSPIPTRPFVSYHNDNRHLPSLTSNLHSILNTPPSSHHLGYNSAFTNVCRRKSDLKDDQPSKLESEGFESDNSLSEIEGIKVQRASIKSQSDDNSFTQENIGKANFLHLYDFENIKNFIHSFIHLFVCSFVFF